MQKKRRSAAVKPEEGMRTIRISIACVTGGMIPHRSEQDPQMNDLAASIARFGLLQPIVVRRGEEKGMFMLVCGARRLAACKLLGRREIDAVLLEADQQEAAVCFLEEHLTKRACDGLSEADALKMAGGQALRASSAFCQSQIDKRLELLALHEHVRLLAKERRLTADQLRPLLGVSLPERQMEAATLIAERALSPRQAQRLIYGPQESVQVRLSSRRRIVRMAMEEISAIAMRLRRLGMGVRVCVHRQEDGICVKVLFEHGEK